MRRANRPALALGLALAACAGTRRPAESRGPDATALARETLVQAREVRFVLSDRWRTRTRIDAINVTRPDGRTVIARGAATLRLEGLRIEAGESLEVRWLSDPEHDSVMLFAKDVALFHQKRDQPYHSTNLSAVSMANDQVSFFQQ